jgi:hypothetical protein
MTSDSKTVRERIRAWVFETSRLDSPKLLDINQKAERIEAALHMTAWSMVHYRYSRDSRTYIPADWIKHGIEAGIAELERDSHDREQ